jgi:uncharacterized membrane protein YgcG
VPALALVGQSDAYYVADEAGVLSDEIERKIISSNADLEQKCDGAQIVVVTVQYLDGMKADEYAVTLFNNWGVGDKEANNGMLLLLATGENKAWLTVGDGIAGSMTNRKIDSYLEQFFWTEFDKGNYETATSNLLEALFSWFADYYNVNQQNGAYAESNFGNTGVGVARENFGAFLFLGIFGIAFFMFLVTIISSGVKDRKKHEEYYQHLGSPTPPYHFWYIWGTRPHRVWWYGPGGPGGIPLAASMMYATRYMRHDQNQEVGDSANSNDSDSGFGGFGGSGGAGSGTGGGGFSSGGGGGRS